MAQQIFLGGPTQFEGPEVVQTHLGRTRLPGVSTEQVVHLDGENKKGNTHQLKLKTTRRRYMLLGSLVEFDHVGFFGHRYNIFKAARFVNHLVACLTFL